MRITFRSARTRVTIRARVRAAACVVPGKVPAVLYGGHEEPRNITLDHQQLLTLIDNEKFYSSIISVNVDAQGQPAIVRDVQMHPARNAVVHVDLQRVVENEKLRIHLPIHFKGEAVAPGVKTQGGIVSHLMQDVEVSCLPKDLPEFLELDLSGMSLNDTLYLADIPLPAGRHDPGAGASQSAGGFGAQPRVPRNRSRLPPRARLRCRRAPRAAAGRCGRSPRGCGGGRRPAAGEAKKADPKKEAAAQEGGSKK